MSDGFENLRPMTPREEIRHRVRRDALEAALSGEHDQEAVAAALAQFRALPEVPLDALHVPEDAGEYRDPLIALMSRIPDGWGRWIGCGPGWYPLITELDSTLAQMDSSYELLQCKEKYGTLRYYTSTDNAEVRERFRAAIHEAEERSAATCELCSAPGSLHETVEWRWQKTLCSACAAAGHRGNVYVPTPRG